MKTKRIHQIIIAFFILITILFVVKTFFSSAISMEDEMHYVATALRFCKGDAFLVDDWSPEQLNGFLLLPFVMLYKIIFRTTDGIILYFRFLYLIFKALITIYSIHRLKRAQTLNVYTLIGVFCYYFFTPYNIDALSYNTIPLSMIFLICIIILTDRASVWDYYLCGILLSIAVLSQPFIAILYFIGLIASIFYSLYVHFTKHNPVPILYLKKYMILTAGVCSIAAIFLLVLLSRATISEVFQNITFIFEEPDHNVASSNMFFTLTEKLKDVFLSFWSFCNGRIATLNLLSIGFIIIGKLMQKKFLPFIFSILVLFLSCSDILIANPAFMMNAIYIPFVWFSIEQFLLLPQQASRHLCILIICIIYTACTALGTNTGILSTSAAMCCFAILSMMLVSVNIPLLLCTHKVIEKISFGIITALLFTTLIMRLCIVWTDFLHPSDYAYCFDKGPLKWTLARQDLYTQYTNIIEDLDSISYNDQDILFCGTSTPAAYLYADVEFGTMGTPFFYLDYNRLEKYFSLHPEKMPTIIYYEQLSNSDEEHQFVNQLKETFEIREVGDGLLAVKSLSDRDVKVLHQ